ncbi:hypothetical protein ACFL96_13670 [Thermoproteota archaeon]
MRSYRQLGNLRLKDLDPGRVFLHKADDTPWLSTYLADGMLRLATQGRKEKIRIYDPFVGNGTIFAAAQVKYSDSIEHMYGWDIKPVSVDVAVRNMDLLTDSRSIEGRFGEMKYGQETEYILRQVFKLYNKSSQRARIPVTIQEGNALFLELDGIGDNDVLVTDPPYGIHSSWVLGENYTCKEDLFEISDWLLICFLENAVEQNFKKAVMAVSGRPEPIGIVQRFFDVEEGHKVKGRYIFSGKTR